MTSNSRCMHPYRLRSPLGKVAVLSGLLAALLSAPVRADEFADISKLIHSGHRAEALAQADAFLARNPRDAQMRFLKGVILTEENKTGEAIAIFTRLTEDYPSLPEPYNNLAVLYAAAGQYDKARAALDAAIRTNPSYATAYENLGDVHAKLASQAYDKALELDSANSAAQTKLTLVRSLVGYVNTGSTAKAAPVAAAAPAPTPVHQKPALAAAPAPKPPAQPERLALAKPAPAPVKAAAKPEVKAESKPEPKQAASSDSGARDAVLDAVQGWAKAWSSQDMKSYLDHYASDFDTPGKQSRKAWEEGRRVRIVGKGRIDVAVETPQVSVDGNTATVKFHQVYVSDTFSGNTDKTLVMIRQGGMWKIKQEKTGS